MFNTTRMQIRIDAAPARVFEALTRSDALVGWFSEQADVGLSALKYDFWGKYTPKAPDRAAGMNRILEVVENQRLSFTWNIGGDDTRVTYALYEDSGGTTVTLRHEALPGGAQIEAAQGYEDFWFLTLENLRRYVEGRASEARVDYTHPMRGDIRHETEIDAPASVVFDVLTNPEMLNRWIATDAKVQPEVGGDYNYGWMYEGMDVGASKIIDIVPGVRLSAQTPDFGPEHPPSVMTWELIGSGGKTRVIFTHSGFADDADVSGMYTGWRAFLNYVRSLAEQGAAWAPPVPVLAADAIAYPKAVYAAQAGLRDELKAS